MKSPHVIAVRWYLKGIRRFLSWVRETFAKNVTPLVIIRSSLLVNQKEKKMRKAKKKTAKKKTAKKAKKKK